MSSIKTKEEILDKILNGATDSMISRTDIYAAMDEYAAQFSREVGELFSPRVWSGKPYASKQISFLPPIKIEKIWDISIKIVNGEDVTVKLDNRNMLLQDWMPIALNDGLELNDFAAWFNLHPKKKEQTFTGQIICWNPDLNY